MFSFAQPLPKHREIFSGECHFRDRIAGIRIESRGDEEQVRLEGHELIERAAHLGDMVRSRRKRGDGKIMDVPKGTSSGSRIARKLVNRRELDPRIIRHNVLGPVAMVRVEIPDRHPFCAVRERV